jgi:uncharacterized protein (DUF697 family)
MQEITKSDKADTIIRNHVVMAMSAGVIPVLIADVIAVTAMQMDMVRQLSDIYGIAYEKNRTKAIIGSLTATALARVGARSLVKVIPGVGWLLGGISVSVFAGASTFALGKVFKKHLESGGNLMDFDPKGMKQFYRDVFQKAKDMIPHWTKDTPEEEKTKPSEQPMPSQTIMASLRELADWRERGLLTETEYQRLKEKLLSGVQ